MNILLQLTGGYLKLAKSVALIWLVLFGISSNIYAESTPPNDSIYLLSGVVLDANTQEPLAGVNIQIKGEFRGTSTDVDGTFSIDVQDDDVLIFSFVGFKTKEIPVAGQTTMEVELEEDSQLLDELIVVGYGLQRRESVTGSIASLGSEKIEQIPSASFETALQGNVAGVQLISPDGAPGANTQIRIRGIGSISASSSPLYVVDGVIVTSGSLSNLKW